MLAYFHKVSDKKYLEFGIQFHTFGNVHLVLALTFKIKENRWDYSLTNETTKDPFLCDLWTKQTAPFVNAFEEIYSNI